MAELYRKTVKPQMLLKKTFKKTKNLLLKTLHNLKSILFGSHQKLPKVCYFNPFFSGSNQSPNCIIIQELDDVYWNHSDHNEDTEGERSITVQYNVIDRESEAFIQSTSKGQILAQKMKELEMMAEEDLDQVLDIEEVLYYYSCLRCPVYLDIVDMFFMDMYNEFSLPQPSFNFDSSMRSIGPVKL